LTTVGVAELKASLSAFLARVKAGETVLVTNHGKPVAQIVPVPPIPSVWGRHLEEMARTGLARLGTGRIPDEYWDMERPKDPEGIALAGLLQEREEGW